MFARSLEAPDKAFFLFGPRGTGKSTWLRSSLPGAYVVNLLSAEAALSYGKNPALFRAEVLARPRTQWIVVDEVQRVPGLLDEVHYLMEEEKYRRFVLTGSSARKLKSGAANLLAGRATVKRLYPLTSKELGYAVRPDQLLRYGAMPLSVTAKTDRDREEFLTSFVTVYLNEEIRSEGLVRDIGAFGRFLEVAALAAGQRTNISNLARDASVSRDTARGYFDLFVDTLLGTWLPAYRPRAKVKEVAHSKFYWFDAGVLHAAAGGFVQPLPADMWGVLLEHVVFHEIQSYLEYSGGRGSLAYWATPSGSEVDFVWWYGERMVAIEVKHAKKYRPEFRKGIAALLATKKAKSFIVYLGDKELMVDGTAVLPLSAFLRELHDGRVLGSTRDVGGK